MGVVALGAIYAAWLGWRYQGMGDYPSDYAPAMNALLAGHIGAFFMHLPTNGAGGSVVLRAPAALVGKLIGGDQLSIFRFGALACTGAAGALGLWLARGMRMQGLSRLWRASVICVCVISPAVLDAILYGHPEEALGAVLCIAAVLLAGEGHSGAAGVVLGLAIINKPWGVLALAPTMLAARERRVRLASAAGAICLVWTAAAYLVDPAHFGRIVLGASTSVVAHPVDLWWPLARLHTAAGVTPAYFPPAWVSQHARELAVLLALPLSLPLLRRPGRSTVDCLGLLALLFLLRCLLDPSNHVYYQLPLILALVTWEARAGRQPLLAIAACAGFWLVFHALSGTGSLTAQFVGYLAVSLPLVVVLLRGGIVPRRDRDGGRQPLPVVASVGS